MTDIDLHLHSIYSDGSDTPAEIMRRAHTLGFDTVALCDHDVLGGLEEARREAEALGMHFIPGIEFSCVLTAALGDFPEDNYYMHILGHGIDYHYPRLVSYYEGIKDRRTAHNKDVQAAFKSLGIDISDEELISHSPGGYICKRSFANVLVERGYGQTVSDVITDPKLYRHPAVRGHYMKKSDAIEVVKLICEAGGQPAFAHPFQLAYKGSRDDSDEVYCKKLRLCIETLKQYGLGAIECAYPTHSAEQRDYLLSLCDRLSLRCSRGSDDHGSGVRPVKVMGEFRSEVPDERLAWVKDFYK